MLHQLQPAVRLLRQVLIPTPVLVAAEFSIRSDNRANPPGHRFQLLSNRAVPEPGLFA